MTDLVQRLRAPHYWMSGSKEGHEGENNAPREAADKIEGLEADLKSTLGVLYRHGDAEARTWLFLNYPAEFLWLNRKKNAPAAGADRGAGNAGREGSVRRGAGRRVEKMEPEETRNREQRGPSDIDHAPQHRVGCFLR